MGMLDTFPKAFETYWPGLGGIDLLVGLAGAAGVYLLIQSKIRQAKKISGGMQSTAPPALEQRRI